MSSSTIPLDAPVAAVRRLLPRTLLARVALIIVVGLAVAQLLAYLSIRYGK